MSLRPSLPRLLAVVLVTLPLAACGDTFVDPFLRDGNSISVTGIFVSGLANEAADTQTLRVQAVRTGIEPPTSPDDPLLAFEAQVVTYDTFERDSTFWTSRTVRFDDGSYGKVFTSSFRPRPGGRYELFVRRDDGEKASGTITIPSAPEGEVLPWDPATVTSSVAWEAAGLDQASARVEVVCGSQCTVVIETPVTVRRLGETEYAVEVDLVEVRIRARALLPGGPDGDPPPPPLTLGVIEVQARLLGPEWVNAEDPSASTLDGAYGFVGGAAVVRLPYRLPVEAALAAGFSG